MLATLLYSPGDVRAEAVPDPQLRGPNDAIVHVKLSAICGTDLGGYAGVDPITPGQRMGHEFLGEVVDVGSEVQTLAKGDLVLAPLVWSDGICHFCLTGLHTSCLQGGEWGTKDVDAGQGEAVRVPWADGTLVRIPHDIDAALLASLLTLSDVLPAGYHAAVSAGVRPGSTVAVIGDGSVGLCSVLASKALGAERIILLGRYPDRINIARRFGATDIVTTRDQAAVDEVRAMTDQGMGADVVIDSFGSEQSMATAVGAVRDGATVSLVGVTHQATWLDVNQMINRNITFRAGIVPARAYIDTLLPQVLSGAVDPSPVFTQNISLKDVSVGYEAMAKRNSVKTLITT